MSRGKRGDENMITLNWSGYIRINEDNLEKMSNFSGVYKLATYTPSTEKYHPFYVGQAEDIQKRTRGHASDSEQNSCIKENFKKYAVYVNYAEVELQSDRDGVEVALYNNYKPDCNDKDALPDVAPTGVNSFN